MYVLLVEAIAVAVIASTATLVSIGGRELVLAGCLAGASMVHLEITKVTERLRELVTHDAVYVNLKTIWSFAALLLLPPPLVAAVIVINYLHMYWRLGRTPVPHRWTFSAATSIMSTAAAGAVLVAVTSTPGRLPAGAVGAAAVCAAAVVRWAVNTLLIGVFLMSQANRKTGRQAFTLTRDDVIEAGALALGMLLALLVVHDAWYVLPGLGFPLVLTHWSLLLPSLEYTATRDQTTGLYSSTFWVELVGKQLDRVRARPTGTGGGLLMLSVDRYGVIADHLGTPAAGTVLRRAAETVRAALGPHDLAARHGDHDIVVLLPNRTPDGIRAIAEQLRQRASAITVHLDGPDGPVVIDQLSVSVAVGGYPSNGATLTELMITVDAALFHAKSSGRDNVTYVSLEATE